MSRVVSFGELMMRLTTPGKLRFSQATELELTFGGAEANTAVSLALFGIESQFVTRLPNNPFGDRAVTELRGLGVDTGRILRGGDRIGVYFLEVGASQRPSVVLYDRAGSAISQVGPGDFDWDAIFAGADWFHFTGITPALGPNVAAVTMEACQAAKAKGLSVSCDLNYRQKLWSLDEARETLSPLMRHVDLLVSNGDQSVSVFGLLRAEDGEVAEALVERFGFKSVALTARESRSADRHSLSASLLYGGELLRSKSYEIDVVDRLGGGDAFTAGLIYGLLKDKKPQEALDFGVAASCLAHSIPGDFNLSSVAEVEALLAGNDGGRVQR